MKNQNTVFITIVSALAFALAPVTKAARGLMVALSAWLLAITTLTQQALMMCNCRLSLSIAPTMSPGERPVHSSWT